MKMEKNLDTPKITMAFASDILRFIHNEWEDLDEDEATVTVEFTVEPSESGGNSE